MLKYLLGFLRSIFNPAVSLWARIDDSSRISRKARVHGRVLVCNSTMQDYSYICGDSRIIHADIGKFCSIAGETKIGMGTHTLDKISTSPIFTEKDNATRHSWVKTSAVNPYKRVRVGNDVWIGARAMVLGGVSISDGAVIGAGAIVTKDVPPYAVVVGVPARVIKYRFPQEQISKLLEHPWWNLPKEKLKKNINLFQDSDSIEEKINELCQL